MNAPPVTLTLTLTVSADNADILRDDVRAYLEDSRLVLAYTLAEPEHVNSEEPSVAS